MKTKLPFPAAVLEQHVAALGKTGSGKSSKLRVIYEWLLERDEPLAIVDPKGDHWGIKSSADGRGSGFPLVIFGGEHADVPITAHAGAHVGELVATGNRSCLVDVSQMMVGERTQFFIDFASTLFHKTRGLKHLFVDEVHNFAPKGKVFDVNAGKMLHWMVKLAGEGRGKGLRLVVASQRPQKVHNDVLDACETLIACKVVHPRAREAISEWIDGAADPAIGKQVMAGLAKLKKPESWIWCPEIELGPEVIEWPMFQTYDSFKPQATHARLKGWASVNLDELREKFARVVAEATANDPKVLRAEIADLKSRLGKQDSAKTAHDVELARQDGFEKGHAAALSTLGGAVAGVVKRSNEFLEGLKDFEKQMAAAAKPAKARTYNDTKLTVPPCPAKPPCDNWTKCDPWDCPRAPGRKSAAAPGAGEAAIAKVIASPASDKALPIGERKVLGALIQFGQVQADQLAVLCGFKTRTRQDYIARLKAKGLVETSGDTIRPTAAGVAALPDFEPLPTGRELQEYWMNRLPPGEKLLLELLVAYHPHGREVTALSMSTGFSVRTTQDYLYRLGSKNLVTRPASGQARASDNLF